MSVFSSIVTVGAIIFLIYISLVLFVYISYVMDFIGKATGFLAYPFKKLWKTAKQLIQKNTNPQLKQRLNNKFSAFGGFAGGLVFIVVALLALLTTLSVLQEISDKATLLILVLENTVMGAFMFGIADGTLTNVTASTVLAIGFSAGFSLLCMNPVSKGKWYINVGMYIFSFITMIGLAIGLDSVFQLVGEWGYKTIIELYQYRGSGFFSMAGRIIALIVLGYVAILMILSTVEQYLSFIAFIPISIAFYGLIQSGISFFLTTIGATENVTYAVAMILTFALIIGVDILRNRYEGLREKIKPLVDNIFLRLFRKNCRIKSN